MRIAIPITTKSIEADINESFGRASFFLLYNTRTNESEFLDHRAVVSQGASGVRAAQVIGDNGIKALITPQCGENAAKILRNAEVLIYKSIPGTIRQNIEALLNDELTLLDEFKSRNTYD